MIELLKRGIENIEDTQVAVLGYAFKAGTDDTRNTPAAKIVNRLVDQGADVRITDPFVPAETIESEVGISPSRLPEALDGADAVLIVTGHDQYRSLSLDSLEEYIGSTDAVIVDGRFIFDPDAFSETPMTYIGVGRGVQK